MNRDQISDYNREFYQRNREARIAYQREYYQRNRERIREQNRAKYAAGDKDEKRKKGREYYQKNRDRVLARTKLYAEQNPDKVREVKRAWRAKNLDRARERGRATHMRMRHGLRPEDWKAMWDAQDGCCYLCGDQLVDGEVHVDHDHSHCGPLKSCRICQRGLAHQDCNHAIGNAYDDPGRLRRMADALEAAQLAVEVRKAAAGEQFPLFADEEISR